MKRYVRFKNIKHPDFEIVFHKKPSVEADVEALLKFIHDSVMRGTAYKPGQTFEIGWMLCNIESTPSGTLTLFEPDFQSFPINWINSSSHTMLHLRLQRSAVESINMLEQVDFPRLDTSGLMCNQFTCSDEFIFDRQSKSKDSGWFFGCDNESHDHNDITVLSRQSLYALALLNPNVVHLLALPVGVSGRVHKRSIELFHDEQKIELVPESYLDQKYPKS